MGTGKRISEEKLKLQERYIGVQDLGAVRNQRLAKRKRNHLPCESHGPRHDPMVEGNIPASFRWSPTFLDLFCYVFSLQAVLRTSVQVDRDWTGSFRFTFFQKRSTYMEFPVVGYIYMLSQSRLRRGPPLLVTSQLSVIYLHVGACA